MFSMLKNIWRRNRAARWVLWNSSGLKSITGGMRRFYRSVVFVIGFPEVASDLRCRHCRLLGLLIIFNSLAQYFYLITCLDRVIILYIKILTVTLRLAVVGVYVKCDGGRSVLHGILHYHWFRSGTVAFIRHHSVGARNFMLRVSGDDSGSIF